MKLYFIQPTPYDSTAKLIKKDRLYFVGLAPAVLAACVPDWDFEVCLETIEEVDYTSDADIIAISGMGHAIIRGIHIAQEFKARGKTVVMGGYMASLMSEEALRYCDSVIIGDGEQALPRLLEDFCAGSLQKIYYEPVRRLSYPLPRYELLTEKRIGDFLPVQAGRGCPHSCSFCSVSCLYRGSYLKRDVEEVLRDIREIKRLGYSKFLLLDDNIASDKDYFSQLAVGIRELGMRWLGQCSIQIADDPELLRLVADSGCMALSFGLESITQESLNGMNKRWARVADYEKQLASIVSAGIDLSTEMVVGADGDTLESIATTADFIDRLQIAVPRFYILTPIPGTDFHKEMQDQGRIINEDIYSYNGAEAVHKPLNMTADQLTEAYWQLYRRVFSLKSILWRTLARRRFFQDPLRHLFYFYVNLIYRAQIRRRIPPNII